MKDPDHYWLKRKAEKIADLKKFIKHRKIKAIIMILFIVAIGILTIILQPAGV